MTTTLIDPDLTINQIVTAHPKALPVLHQFGLDACCGGSHPLRFAVERHGLVLDEVISQLAAALATPA